jgi:hypothetical protein
VSRHERSIAPAVRRRRGAHYTPAHLAETLAELGLEALGRVPSSVCDPSCGAGAFLLAAADVLHRSGLEPEAVLARLAGADVDPSAVSAARAALGDWAVEHGVPPSAASRSDLRVADTLHGVPRDWTRRFELVVGNPPFLGQLSRDTARDAAERQRLRSRFPEAAAYTDTSALFLLASLDLVTDDGVGVLIQPQSLLAARDARRVRQRVLQTADLVGIWATDRRPFAAEVEVCAPVLRPRRHRARSLAPGAVEIRWGDDARPVGTAPAPAPGRSWGPLLAGPLGIPHVPSPAPTHRRLGELATATAGFRDEFYDLVAACRDDGLPAPASADPRLVTVGMVDPGRLTWGTRPRRLGGRTVTSPRLDLAQLERRSPRTAAWVRRRLRPKVLVATQTRVLEAAVDPAGDTVPVTPTIAVEPSGGTDPWALAAALSAPPVSARAAAEHLGTGLSAGAVRWSAAAVVAVALPVDTDAWARGTVLARRLSTADGFARTDLLHRLGRTMCVAHGLDPGHEVLEWWFERARRT